MKRRIAVTGGPKTGKTTSVRGMEGVRHTDNAGADWEVASDTASKWFSDPTVNVIEGVLVPHALRKWLRTNHYGKPVDEVVIMRGAHRSLSKGQRSMTKGVNTVMREIAPELQRRGVLVRWQ